MDKRQILEIMKHMEKEGGTLEISLDDLFTSISEESMPNPNETASKLKEYFELFKTESHFKEGLLVSWKRGLKNRRYPRYGEPAIVLKVLEEPVFSEEKDSGSPNFLEPLDMILGVIINDDFGIFYYDKRRFVLFDGGI